MTKTTTLLTMLCFSACSFGNELTEAESEASSEDTAGSTTASASSGSDASASAPSSPPSSSSSPSAQTTKGSSTSNATEDSSSSGENARGALLFDGTDEATSAPIAQSTLPAEFTVELWIETGDDPYYGVLIDARDTDVDNGWVLNLQRPDSAIDPNTIRLGWSADDGSSHGLTGPEVHDLAPGWHHFAFTRNADGLIQCWLDGLSIAEGPSDAPPLSQVTTVSVGRFLFGDPESGYWWRGGAMDDIHISNTARYTQAFVPAAAQADANSILLWHFDELEGDVAIDEVSGVELSLASPAWVEGHS